MKAGSFTWSGVEGGEASLLPSWETPGKVSLQNHWRQLEGNTNVCYLGKVLGENEMLDTKTNYYCQVRKMVESITEPLSFCKGFPIGAPPSPGEQ